MIKTTELQQYEEIIPTFIIGVGGTGISVLQSLKGKFPIKSVTPSGQKILEIPPSIQLLGIDLAPQTLAVKNGIELSTDEFLRIAVNIDVQKIIANMDSYPHIKKIWKKDFFYSGTLEEGAGQRRLLGRLALFWNLEKGRPDDKIDQRLDAKFDFIRNEKTLMLAQERQRKDRITSDVEKTIHSRVIVISSLGGGVGSGMFIDICMLMKDLLSPEDDIIGIFVLPEAFSYAGSKEGLMANTYAAFAELEYYFNNGFSCEYTNTVKVPQDSDPFLNPFKQVYLINGTSRGGTTLTQDQIITEIANALNNYIGPDLQQMDLLLKNTNIQRPNFYSSFGFGALVLPIEEIINYCTAVTCINILDRMLTPVDIKPVKTESDDFFTISKIKKEDVYSNLNSLVAVKRSELELGGISLDGVKVGDLDNHIANNRNNQSQKIATLKSELTQLVQKDFEENVEKGYKDKRIQFENKVIGILNDDKKGLMYALKFIENTINDINTNIQEASKDKETKFENMKQVQEKGAADLEEFKKIYRSILKRMIPNNTRNARISVEEDLKAEIDLSVELVVLDAYLLYYSKYLEKAQEMKKELENNLKYKLESSKNEFLRMKNDCLIEIKNYEDAIKIEDIDWFVSQLNVNIQDKVKVLIETCTKLSECMKMDQNTIQNVLYKFIHDSAQSLKNITLMDYMKKGIKNKNFDPANEIRKMVDLTYPLWEYKSEKLDAKPVNLTLMFSGKEKTLPELTQLFPDQETGIHHNPIRNEHKIQVIKYDHGLPIRVLHNLKKYKSNYLNYKAQNWPLHGDYSIDFKEIPD